MAETEAGDNFIPARRWIRGHYTKLTKSNKARCNHCTEKFIMHFKCSAVLHKHLVNAHPDKLTEEEKKEVKFHWTWDYFILKGDKKAICKECKKIIKYSNTIQLKDHLEKIHMISDPTSNNVIDNECSSDDDMDANKDVTLRKDLIPMRRWMREHYTKLTRNRAGCNHCNEKFSISMNHLATLYKHLIEAHPDKLTEEEKNEVKFHWAWDYYIEKSSTETTCKQCKATIRYKKVNDLKKHLKRKHGISGPTSDNVIDNEESSSDDDMDANKDITLRKDLIPIRRWMREHYTKLTRNRARCNHCNTKFGIHTTHLYKLHKHLIEAHPDKLTEEEKNEVKFHWAWDYYITGSNKDATCKLCKVTVRYQDVTQLKRHLKRHHE
ncbi:uncharacterized protein [Mycetomoellerius zeteki]|uniref:uncharacterized protein n=1 Tax=Mycetomoellerius zeteki TaxID=64791 RepID=UPI00084E9756|nr:PREDICTED: uncharacterized protein LOC108725963 [Trachymyrmex zeteki]